LKTNSRYLKELENKFAPEAKFR